MAISTAQYIDLLFKKLQGVAKTATAAQKSASNESIASPALLRGDIVWTQADQIPSTAQVVANVTQGYLTTSRIECTADTTVPTIGGIYPTWLTNLQYWIPQEFGSTWPVKVWVDTAGAANPTVTGTQIFAPGIGGVGEFFFDTQAGVLNFIGETIPTTLTAGKSIFITGYRYVGQLGVTNLPNANIGNIQITGNTIVTLNTNGDLVFDPNGSGNIRLVANTSITGNVTASGFISATGDITGNNIFYGSGVVSGTGNIYGNNLFVTNIESVTGNIQGGNLLTGGVVSATATITGGNLSTGGTVSATGNITGANVNTTGLSLSGNVVSDLNVTGNVTSPNVSVTSLTSGQIAIASTNGLLVGGPDLLWDFANAKIFTTGLDSNGAITTSGLISATGNVTGGNLLTVGTISTAGNVLGNAILSDNYFYANGQPIPSGIVYTAASAPPANPDVGDQWYDIINDVLYEFLDDGTSTYWVDSNSPAFAGGVVANVAISGTLIPIANVTYDIGTSTEYFRNTYTQNLYTNNRFPAYNMPLGAVVQTVMSSSLGGSVTNSTSYADVSSATVTITPSSSTSKILILATGTTGFTSVSGANVTADTQLVRSPSTSLQIQTVGASSTSQVGTTGSISYSYMDNPGTTSAVTYKLQQKVSNASSTLTSTNIWLIALEITAS